MFALPLESRISYLIRTNLARVWPSFVNSYSSFYCRFRSKPLLIITHVCDADCISQTVQARAYLVVFFRLLSPNLVIVRMHPTPCRSAQTQRPLSSIPRCLSQPRPPPPAAFPSPSPSCSPGRLPAPPLRLPPRAAASPAFLPVPQPRPPPHAAASPAPPR